MCYETWLLIKDYIVDLLSTSPNPTEVRTQPANVYDTVLDLNI